MAARSFYVPSVSVDDFVAKLLAPGGLPKRNKKFTVSKESNGNLDCWTEQTNVEIRFAPDSNGVRVAVVPTKITRLNGMNVSFLFVWQMNRGVKRAIRALQPTAS